MRLPTNSDRPFIVRRAYLLTGISLFALYLISFPENRTDADDSYWYASLIRYHDGLSLFRPRFLVFLPAYKSIVSILGFIGIHVDVYFLICVINAIFSAATIVIFYLFLNRRLGYTHRTSLITAGLLAFSYGFWRYAIEVEVYAISCLLIVVFLHVLYWDRQEWSISRIVLLSFIGGFGVLWHKSNFIVFYLCLPLQLLLDRQLKALVIYGFLSASVVFSGYALAYHFMLQPPLHFSDFLLGGVDRSGGSPYSALFTIATNQIALGWLFGFSLVTSLVSSIFPRKSFVEEIYAAQHAPALGYISLISFLLVIVIFVVCLRKALPVRVKVTNVVIVFMVWMVVYSTFVIIFDPTSSELWLGIQLPLVSLFGIRIIDPLVTSFKHKTAYLLAVLLLSHNFIGGLLSLKSATGNYFDANSDWLHEHIKPNDLILTYGPWSYVWYLKYNLNVDVYYLEGPLYLDSLQHHIDRVLENQGNIYATDDVVNIVPAVKFRSERKIKEIDNFFENERINFREVAMDRNMKIYQMGRPDE